MVGRQNSVMTRLLLALCASLSTALAYGQSAAPLAARSKGRPDAPVTVYEMSDFQCPYCRGFALNTLPILEREYVQSGKVRFVYINLPLPTAHANAVAAAEVAMCAARQGKFWPMHDLLFRYQDEWALQAAPVPYLVALGDSAGLNHAQLAQCVASKATAPEVQADAERSTQSGARSTPTFYVEGGLLEGAAPVAVFRAVLDSIYQSKTRSRPR
jgi:protein-disulfide isomerase